MGNIIEGRWDCSYCDTHGIRGSVRVCPNCGKTRGKDVKFYIGDPTDYVSKPIKDVPDWLCSYCDTYNSATLNVCHNCGHTKADSDKNYFEIQKEKDVNYTPITKKYLGKKSNFVSSWVCSSCGSTNVESDYICQNCGAPKDFRQEFNNNNKSQQESSSYNTFSNNSHFALWENREKHRRTNINYKYILFPIIAILLISLIVFLFIPKRTNFTVTGYEWSNSINIEEYKTVRESDWSVPQGGRVQYTQSEIHHYESVLDHYETRTREVSEQVIDGYDTVVTGHRDMGNGYFEEITEQVPRYRTEYHTETYEEPIYVDVPVYQIKYYYDIDKWVYARSVKTSGVDKSPYFGEVNLALNEREAGRNSKFVFVGNVEGEEREIEVNKSIWEKYFIEDNIPIKLNRLGIITLIEQ